MIHYKPGKDNIFADALSRRPDYEPCVDPGHRVVGDEKECVTCAVDDIHATAMSPVPVLRQQIVEA